MKNKIENNACKKSGCSADIILPYGETSIKVTDNTPPQTAGSGSTNKGKQKGK